MAENTTANQNTRPPVTGSKLIYIILLVGFSISLLLQVIGLVTPGWLVADFSTSSTDFRFSMGLWYVNFCYEGTCDSSDFDTFWETHYKGPKRIVSHDMDEYRAETIIGIISIVIGIGGICKLLLCSPNGLFNNPKYMWSGLCAASALSVLGSLFLLCHGAGGQRQCTELLKSCPKIYCNSVINSPLKCAGCFNISAVCVRLKRSNPSCELYFGEDKYDCDSREKDSHEEQISNLLEKDSNDSADSNNTTVIVVAVCVSLVVIIISVLIAVVYCWRVRRVSRERKKQGNVETRQRNSQTNIEVTENNLETSRPNSTYCTINDMGNTNEYHVLEPQDATEVNVVDRDRDLSDYCANVTIAKHGVDRVDVSNDADYNRIVFNQIKEAKPDPSYSHLAGVEPLYGGDAESINKVSGYQYGVPIKIRNKNQLQSSEHDLTNNIKPVMNSNAKDKIENTEYEVNAETQHLENSYKMKPDNSADDDYVIPKEGQRNSMNTIDGKPKAIVNPIVNLDDNELTTEVIKNQCDKDTVGDDQEDTSRNSDVQSERIDDYELAAFKNSVSSEKVDVSNAKIELPTVRKDYNTKQITEDGYEKAVVNTAILSEKSDIVKGKLELPTVQILHNTKQMTDDGYETAVINKVETVDVDKNN